MEIVDVLIVLGVIVGSMILHELAHGVVAYVLGDDTAKENGRLTLNPLKHLDPFMSIVVPILLYISGMPIFGGAKPVPIDPGNFKHRERDMALVGIAGPLTNFVLAFVFFLIGYWTGLFLIKDGGMYIDPNDIWSNLVASGVLVNLGFMIFNLIPIPPLDGSRVLYAIAPDGVRNVMLLMERFGIIIIYALIVIMGGAFSSLIINARSGILSFFCWIVGA